ncbi:MAG: hypothetical protein QM755_02695 [Luteolibacter sp.]
MTHDPDHKPSPPRKRTPAKKTLAKKASAKKTSAKKAATTPPPRPPGRPSLHTPDIVARIIEGLCDGVPLTLVCRPDDMPGITTVWEWTKKDPAFAEAIARAREAGFDRIALDAIAIADSTGHPADPASSDNTPAEPPNKDWILWSKLRVDTRLKLLSTWDPKRYGEKATHDPSAPGGNSGNPRPDPRTEADLEKFAAMYAKARTNLDATPTP